MKRGKTLEQFEEKHGGGRVQALQAAVDAMARQHRKIVLEVPGEKNSLRFGLIGDTHYGSLYEAKEQAKALYRRFASEGITTVLHAGDVLDGHRIYRGQEFEIHALGWQKQRDWFAQEAPTEKGITTHFITGNHDSSLKKIAGIDVGTELEHVRPDWKCLGEEFGNVTLKTPSGLSYMVMLLHPSGGSAYAICLDDETEILTERGGWKHFKQLLPKDRVATLNPETELFEWQHPTAYTDELYSGKMYHFTSRSVDLKVTPNHRMFVRRYPTAIDYGRKSPSALQFPTKSHYSVDGNWQFVEASDLADARRQEWQMTRCVKGWIGESPEFVKIPTRSPKRYASTPIKHIGSIAIEDAAELIAWYVTEGYIPRSGKELTICQSQRVNPHTHNQILDLLRRLGFPHAHGKGRDGKDITVCSAELCEWLLAECGRGSRAKYLPYWLKNCDGTVLQIVFDTMVAGDGWQNGPSVCYRSISKRLRDDFSEIAIKIGYGVTEYGDSISTSRVQKYPTINTPPVVSEYVGRIYCVSVPNSVILVRRNGRAVFTGNSYRAQKIVEQLEGGRKPNLLAIGNFHKAEHLPSYRNIAVCQVGCLQFQTPFMMTKGLAAHVGGWIMRVTPGEYNTAVRGEFVAFYAR